MDELHRIAEINAAEIKLIKSKLNDPNECRYQKAFWESDIVNLKYSPKIYWSQFKEDEEADKDRLSIINQANNYYNQKHVQPSLFD